MDKVNINIEENFRQVLNCAFRVHSALGPGLLENAFEECLYFEIMQCGMMVEK
jgi:GxxExxY protein